MTALTSVTTCNQRDSPSDCRVRQPVGIEAGEYLPASVILQLVGGTNMKDINATKLGRALTAMGFESKMTRGIRRYRVVRRSTSEMQQHRQEQCTDSESGGVVE